MLIHSGTNLCYQISVYDAGPKLISLGTASSNAYKSFDIRVGSFLYSGIIATF
jgi:alpha,alpha-trehalase